MSMGQSLHTITLAKRWSLDVASAGKGDSLSSVYVEWELRDSIKECAYALGLGLYQTGQLGAALGGRSR